MKKSILLLSALGFFSINFNNTDNFESEFNSELTYFAPIKPKRPFGPRPRPVKPHR